MQYLIDTDWVIHALHGLERVTTHLAQLAPDSIGLSIVSMAELYQGVFYSTDPIGNERALRDFLSNIEIIHLDDDICRIFATERGRLRASGTIIGDFDILIGATAIRHNLTLLTNNLRHFERLRGLNIIST